MNNVCIMGRLCRDPEGWDVGNGKQKTRLAKFTIAIDRGYGEDAATDYIPVTVWGAGAEFAEQYCFKGLRVAITGRLQSGSYENKNGDTVYTLDVIASRIEFADSKKEDSGNNAKKRRS